MFSQKRTISSHSLYIPSNTNNIRATFHTEDEESPYMNKQDLLQAKVLNKKESTVADGYLMPIKAKRTDNLSVPIAPIVASAVAMNSIQTVNISQAFHQLKQSIISRGTTYANNTPATRRGFIAENFTAESYNIDAVIKRIPDRAIVNGSNGLDSADLTYDYGNKQASLKYYADAEASAKAQLNTGYGDQARIIPADQLEEAKNRLIELARKNDLKGRPDAADIQRKTADLLDSVIKGSDGAESIPLTKENADEIAKAFTVDESGNKIADLDKLNDALKKTGATQKVQRAKFMNELRGIGLAAAIGLGIGFGIGVIVSLAQNGLDSNSLKYALASGAREGINSGLLTMGSATIGVAMRTPIESLAGSIISKLSVDVASEAAKNILTMCSMGVVGSITIISFSVYSFVKLKQAGYGTKECLLRTGKTAALSFSVLIISIIAQGIWGGPAGMVVSITAGVIMVGYTLYKIKYDKTLSRNLTFYSIELSKPKLATI